MRGGPARCAHAKHIRSMAIASMSFMLKACHWIAGSGGAASMTCLCTGRRAADEVALSSLVVDPRQRSKQQKRPRLHVARRSRKMMPSRSHAWPALDASGAERLCQLQMRQRRVRAIRDAGMLKQTLLSLLVSWERLNQNNSLLSDRIENFV